VARALGARAFFFGARLLFFFRPPCISAGSGYPEFSIFLRVSLGGVAR